MNYSPYTEEACLLGNTPLDKAYNIQYFIYLYGWM